MLSNTSKFTEKNIRIIKTKEVNKKYFTGSHKVENYLEATFDKGSTKFGIKGVRSPLSALNKMYPLPKKEKSKITQFINPFEKSICELRPELCYD